MWQYSRKFVFGRDQSRWQHIYVLETEEKKGFFSPLWCLWPTLVSRIHSPGTFKLAAWQHSASPVSFHPGSCILSPVSSYPPCLPWTPCQVPQATNIYDIRTTGFSNGLWPLSRFAKLYCAMFGKSKNSAKILFGSEPPPIFRIFLKFSENSSKFENLVVPYSRGTWLENPSSVYQPSHCPCPKKGFQPQRMLQQKITQQLICNW